MNRIAEGIWSQGIPQPLVKSPTLDVCSQVSCREGKCFKEVPWQEEEISVGWGEKCPRETPGNAKENGCMEFLVKLAPNHKAHRLKL